MTSPTRRRLPSAAMQPLSSADESTLGQLNLIEYTREDARWQTPHEIVERDGILLFTGSSDFPAFSNGVRRVDDSVPGPVVVETATEFFAARNRGFSLWTRDLALDDDLHAAAVVAGINPYGTSAPQMICRTRVTERDLPPGVTLEPITTRDEVEAYATLSGDAYSVYGAPTEATASHFNGIQAMRGPHVHGLLARLDGEPVGGALILLSHGIAGVYWVGVLEQARGRGIAFSVTARVTNLAFDLGAVNVQLQASEMGEPVYLRMGYEELYRHRLHLSIPGL
jgi:GNAT superfamily N-acetyltransferase